MSAVLRISALYVHPIKSCTGLRVDSLELDEMGAIGDRRFMLVDEAGSFVSQREEPRLALVRVAQTAGGGVVLHAPASAALSVAAPGAHDAARDAAVWGERAVVRDCGDEAAAWFSALLGAKLRLVHAGDDCGRGVDARYAPSSARSGLTDGFPLLLATDASLEDLSRRAGQTFEMERFRPNVVVSGSAAWEEDSWETLEVGDVSLRLVKPCSRCSITVVDPKTAERGVEPLRTLATFRRGAHLGYPPADVAKTYFGWNLLHDRRGTLRVGDVVRATTRRAVS